MLFRDSNDLLWYAIVGNTEMFLSYKIEDDRYSTRHPGEGGGE